jgi:colicin import membrane protein
MSAALVVGDAQPADVAESPLEVVSERKALVPAEVFKKGGVEAVVSKIEVEVRAIKRDISTPKGRAAIRSLALKVSKSKTALDGMGKDLTEEWARLKAGVDADRRLARERLDALRDEVLAPLERWEEKDRQRVAAHEAALMDIRRAPGGATRARSVEIAARLVELREPPARDWQEFEERAAEAYAAQIAFLEGLLEERKAEEEAEAAEAARQAAEAERKREEAEAAQKAREAKIAEEAAERARQEADERAAAEAQRVEREREAERRRAEQAAEEAADREAMLKAQAERDRVAAAERLKEAEAQTARQAAAFEEQRLADIAEAEAAERRRAEAERLREAREAEARAKDRAHRGAINRAAAGGFEAAGCSPEQARELVALIARGGVPHVAISY